MGAKDGILASSGPSFDIQARHPVLVTTSELWSVRFHVLLGSSINLFLTTLIVCRYFGERIRRFFGRLILKLSFPNR
jgi:hypothetical protein